jgi:arsenite-transporting ATPase
MLLRMADAIYGQRDPAERFYESSAQKVEKVGAEYVLSLNVPFADRTEVDLARHDGELYVTVGSFRREISLPRVLANRRTLGASIDDGRLKVRFGDAAPK